MGFPADETDLEVGAAFGANIATAPASLTYETITDDVRPQVVISRGRVARSSTTRSTTIGLQLRNEDGVYSPRNIAGPRYGTLRQQTPIRVRLDPGSGMVTRGTAYVPDWPPEWTGPDIDDRIPVQAGGIMQRLSIGQESKSALRRTILATAPRTYWPLEDASSATAGAELTGGSTMKIAAGTVTFGAVTDLVGASGAPDISAGAMIGFVYSVSSAHWHCQFAVKSGLMTGSAAALRIKTDSTLINVLHIFLPFVGDDRVQVFIDDDDIAGPLIALNYTTPPGTWADRWHHIGIEAQQSGANVIFRLWVDGALRNTNPGAVGQTLGKPTRIQLNHNYESNTEVDSFDHVMFGDGAIQSGYYEAISGYNGESAGDRVGRLCDEEGLVHDVAAGDTELMGPQLPGDILSLLRECEDSDEAVLVERRTGEIGFDPHVTRLNLAVTMTLDYETVADMVVDDSVRDATNRATVSRIGGSSGTHERTDGARGSNPATGIGVYPATPQRSLNADDIAVQHASWIVNIGTVDEPRYVITVDLHHTPELVTQWLGCDIGSRILVTGPPAIRTGPAPLDLILEGYDEVLDATSWLIVLYLEPYRPYEVLEIGNGGDNRSRIAAGVSTTDAAYSASATSLSVTSASVRWIDSATYSSRFPITIVIAGEVMTCTAITGTGLTQTFTVTRGLHGVAKTLPIGSAVQVWRAAAIAL